MNIEEYLSGLERFAVPMTEMRRDFHRYAEPGWKEFRTTAKIIACLKEHGIPFQYGHEIINREY